MSKSKAATGPSINIGISDKDRSAIAKGLSTLLADTYTLYLIRAVAPQDLPNEAM